MTSEAEFIAVYKEIKHKSDIAQQQLERTYFLDEQGDVPLETIASYKKCLRHIDHIFNIQVGLPDNIDNVSNDWNKACKIIQDLKMTKNFVENRLKELETQVGNMNATTYSNTGLLSNKQFGAYDPSERDGDTLKMYKHILKYIREKIETKDSNILFENIFHSQVTLYKIEASGEVKTLSGEISMTLDFCTIPKLELEGRKHIQHLYVIKCILNNQCQPTNSEIADEYEMIWIYPLLPEMTTCYVTEFNAFIFPDLEGETPGAAFGLILRPSELSEKAKKDFQQTFMDIIETILNVEDYTFYVQHDFGSHHILTGANFIANNLIRGAEKAGELMVKGTPYITAKMQPAQNNGITVSPTVQTTVQIAKGITGAAVGLTTWVAGKVGSASVALGRFLAPRVQYYGANLLKKTCGLDNEEANSKMEGALNVAANTFEGFSTIVNGLEKSAAILGNNISENSVKIIEHKYGSSAGSLAAGTFDTLGSAFVVSRNVNYMFPKGIAKNLVKKTGKAIISEYQNCQTPHFVTADNLYPDLRGLKEHVNQKSI